jgi:hypothetical protein
MNLRMNGAVRAVVAAFALLASASAHAANGRLLAMEAAEPIDRFVIGLQKTAVPLFGGLALDTSLLADIALAPNLGIRWSTSFGDHRVVVGARYTLFVGAGAYSSFINGQQPVVKRFEPTFGGPSLYAVYGYNLGSLGFHVEGRYANLTYASAGVNGAVAWKFAGEWAVVGELGYRFLGPPPLHAALGIRFTGEHFGFSLGAAYVGIDDPLLPSVPFLPALDLSWTF